jgi:FMN phosphatase YigB (HAD superfamily)
MDATARYEYVFLIDVDNTLLDNDSVSRDLKRHLKETFGEERRNRFWEIFEELRGAVGYADYLGALQRYRLEHPRDPRLLETSLFLVDYPFAGRLFSQAIEVVEWLRRWGPAVIFSDGDAVFQPRKVSRSGLWHAVLGQVLIYVHKEEMLDDVEQRYPSRHYVVIDDKLRILTAIKAAWGDRVTTIFPRQGHYALDPKNVSMYPAADLSIDHISELLDYDIAAIQRAANNR